LEEYALILLIQCNDIHNKVIHVPKHHTMKGYRGSGQKAPCIQTESSYWRQVVSFI